MKQRAAKVPLPLSGRENKEYPISISHAVLFHTDVVQMSFFCAAICVRKGRGTSLSLFGKIKK
jgi:hypothetical protein